MHQGRRLFGDTAYGSVALAFARLVAMLQNGRQGMSSVIFSLAIVMRLIT